MLKILDYEVEGAIKTLSNDKFSHTTIHLKLKVMGHIVSLSSISRILNGVGKGREAINRVNEVKIKLYQRQHTSRTPTLVKKVK